MLKIKFFSKNYGCFWGQTLKTPTVYKIYDRKAKRKTRVFLRSVPKNTQEHQTFIDSPTFCLSVSIFITLTFTTSPTETISEGFFINLSLISEI